MKKQSSQLDDEYQVDDHGSVDLVAFVTTGGKATVFPRDIFISHASEDKDRYARPLNRALNHLGVSTWFDDAMIQDGDSLTESVGQGLSKATIVVLLITENFVGKGWPEVELRNALSREISTGVVRIIPIVDVDHAKLVAAYPLIEDKRYRQWTDDVDSLAISLRSRIGRESSDWHYGLHPEIYTGPVWTRVTPRNENLNSVHTVTIIWGQYKVTKDIFPSTEPISLIHHKTQQSNIPMQIHVVPAAFVSVGQGVAPDPDAINCDEGWTRLAGAPLI